MALQYSRPKIEDDFEFYEQITPDPVRTRRAKARSRGRTALKVIAYTLIGAVCVFLILAVLANYAKLTKLSMEESELTRELSDLKEQEARLTVDIDKKTTLKDIEYIATNTFGMVKIQDYQREYIDMKRSDKAEIVNSSPVSDISSQTQTIFGTIKEYLSRDESQEETAAAEITDEAAAETAAAEAVPAEEYPAAQEEYIAAEE
ncbi:MAG: hypothetical protein IKD89_03650 [Clostridia bacterium]|nr:hypothetical protein [Clostridia bacterium]